MGTANRSKARRALGAVATTDAPVALAAAPEIPPDPSVDARLLVITADGTDPSALASILATAGLMRLLARMVECLPTARKVAVAVSGFSVLAVGVALLVLPGPGLVVIAIGLAILAREFPWAARLVGWLKSLVHRMRAARHPHASQAA